MANRLSVRGHALEFQSWGHGNPPIVLLHEGLGSVSRWRDFPPELAHRVNRRVVAYSRAGHGASDPPAVPRTVRFMHEEASEWLPEFLDRAEIERAILLGHSDGGSIALMFAASYPARVDALVLEAPHVFVEDVSVESIADMRGRFESTDLRARMSKHHRDPEAAFRGWSGVWLDPAFRAWNLEEFLPHVSCPVLLIQGRQDTYGTLRQIDTIAAGVAGPVEVVVLDDCGHSPHRDQREQTLAAIIAFLARAREYRSTAE